MPSFSSSPFRSQHRASITKECILFVYCAFLTTLVLAFLFVPSFQDMLSHYIRRNFAFQRHDFIHSLHDHAIQTQVVLQAAIDVGLFDHLASATDDNRPLSVGEIASDLDLDVQTLRVCVMSLIALDLLDVHKTRRHSHGAVAAGDQLISLSKIAQTYLISPEQRLFIALASLKRDSDSSVNMFSFLTKMENDGGMKETKEEIGDEEQGESKKNVNQKMKIKNQRMTRDQMLRAQQKQQQDQQFVEDASLVDLVNIDSALYVGNSNAVAAAADGNNFGFLEKLSFSSSCSSSSDDHSNMKNKLLSKLLKARKNKPSERIRTKVNSAQFFFADAVASFDALHKLTAKRLLSREVEINRKVSKDVSNGQNILHVSSSRSDSSLAFGAIVLDSIPLSRCVFLQHRHHDDSNDDVFDETVASRQISKFFSPNRAASIIKRSTFDSSRKLVSKISSPEEMKNEKQFELILVARNFFQNFDQDRVLRVASNLLKMTKAGGAICIIEGLKSHDRLPSVTEKSEAFGHYLRSVELTILSDDRDEEAESFTGQVFSSNMFKQMLLKAGWIRVELFFSVIPKTHTVIIARKGLI